MKRWAVILVGLAIACGSSTAPVGAPLTIDQLKFKVIDAAGPPAFCDPDFYPVARAGGEQASADAQYPQIRADAEIYSAIVEHEHLPSGELDEGQKLTLYRAFKKLRALKLTPSGGGYGFAYTAITSSTFTAVQGTVLPDGTVTVASSAPGSRPNCPICLAATTVIATPDGPRVVTSLTPGMPVWTESAAGARIAVPVLEVGSTQVPPGHVMVHLRLADGRELWASPGHRTADGRPRGGLAAGETLDGSQIVVWELVPYSGDRTYDLLPAGPTGDYWANGILLASTLGTSQRPNDPRLYTKEG
jgi:hypothetical protein